MRILLTGGTGYLGSHLAQALLQDGHSLVILKRQSSALSRLAPIASRITFVDVDELDITLCFKEYGKLDAVIHTATNYGRNGESENQIADVNLNFPLRLLVAAIDAGTRLFINTDTALDKFLNAYSLSKRQFTEWGEYFAKQKKITFVNLKLEHFYGANDDISKFTTHVINSCLKNEQELKLTLGEQKRDFIYIDDVINAFLLLLDKSESLTEWFTEFEVGSGEAVSIRQFVELVYYLTGSNISLNFGAYPYRVNEAMLTQANIKPLQKLGWSCEHTLEQGLNRVIKGNS
jgi:nucleoside-diphosphate-sugar epimerase